MKIMYFLSQPSVLDRFKEVINRIQLYIYVHVGGAMNVSNLLYFAIAHVNGQQVGLNATCCVTFHEKMC